MIPAYHDAVTAVIFLMMAVGSICFGIGRDPDGEKFGGVHMVFLITLGLAVSYGVVWATVK